MDHLHVHRHDVERRRRLVRRVTAAASLAAALTHPVEPADDRH
jgi:hypothetical protein